MKIFRQISDLFFPPQCIFCENTLKLAQRPLVCENCIGDYLEVESKCPKCGGKIQLNDGLMPSCYTCKIAGRYYDGATFAFEYHEKVKNAIHRYKFARHMYVGDQLAVILARKLRDIEINRFNIDVVLAVPSDKTRNASRGFDAAGNLAAAVAKELRIRYVENGIVRVKDIERQSTLSYSKRQKNVRGAFKVSNSDFIRGKRILLIDDIITTGATVTEISRILKRAGAAYVFVATAAKRSKPVTAEKNTEN